MHARTVHLALGPPLTPCTVCGYLVVTGAARLVVGDGAHTFSTFSHLLTPSHTFYRVWWQALRVWSSETELTGAGGPSEWALQFYSQYEFSPDSRPLYRVPVTAGFCRGINRAHAALRRAGRTGRPVTLKPFLVLGSKGDDVLKGNEVRDSPQP